MNITLNSKVDAYLARAKKWKPEMERLRELLLNAGLAEDLKWGKPCYSLEGSNLGIIIAFKDYCALMFFKGVLLKDPKKLLLAPGENSQTARQLRFTGLAAIHKLEPVIRAYVKEAIALEKSGAKIEKKTTEHPIPDEFQKILDKKPAAHKAFAALTPGRRRAYLMFFSAAKQSKTREARVLKHLPGIMKGIGLNDR